MPQFFELMTKTAYARRSKFLHSIPIIPNNPRNFKIDSRLDVDFHSADFNITDKKEADSTFGNSCKRFVILCILLRFNALAKEIQSLKNFIFKTLNHATFHFSGTDNFNPNNNTTLFSTFQMLMLLFQ